MSFEEHAQNGLAPRGQAPGVLLSSDAATGGLCAFEFHQLLIAALLFGAAFPFAASAQTAADYSRRAAEAAKGRDWQKAEDLYRRALDLSPKDSVARFELGSILLSQQRIKDALGELTTASQLDPHNPVIGCTIARADLQDGRPADAINGFKKCLPGVPKDAESYYYYGIALGQEGQIKDAAVQFRRVIAIRPDFGPAHQSLGISLRRTNEDSAALEEFRIASKLMPDNPIAWCDLGLALKSNGDNKAAIGAFRQALALQPDYERAQYGLGIALKKEGQDAAAAAQMQSVSKRRQEQALRARAQKLVLDGSEFEHQRKPQEAEAAYLQALDLVPDFATAHMALGILYARTGDSTKAAEQLRQASLNDSDSAEAHYNYALVLAGSGQFEAAQTELTAAIALDPDNLDARIQLGLVLMQRKDFDRAAAVYREAIRKQPRSAEAYNNLGLVWLQAGNAAKAKEAFQQAVQLKGDYAVAHYNLALSLDQLGEKAAAKAELDLAYKLDPALAR